MLDLMKRWTFIVIVMNPFINGDVFKGHEEENVISFVENVMECRKVPGLALSVVKGNETWTRGFGFADIKSGRKVAHDTLFVIGSLGKAFTMTLLGNLIQNTSYTWDTKISDIDGLNLDFIDDEITREATLSDLLAHRTGLSSVNDYGFIAGYPAEADREFLSKRTKYIPKTLEFRNSFQYNNMMYMLLGHVTELLGRDSWDNLVTSRVFEPIGMLSSKVLLTSADVQQGNVAKPYILPEDQLEDGNYDIYRIVPLEPAGGILSNADDMARWIRFNLRNGSTEDGQQLLPDDLLQEAFKDQNMLPFGGAFVSQTTPRYPINDITKAYGYAWFTSTYRGFRRIWHSGGLFSYVSLLWLYPDEQLGVFANINGPGTVRDPGYALKAVLSYVSDILLSQTPWLNIETACSYPSPWVNSSFSIDTNPEPDNFTNDRLDDFVGKYGNELLPDITISVKERGSENEYLWLEMNRIKGELLLTADVNVFKFKMEDPWEYAIERVLAENLIITYPIEFTRSEDGVVESFNLTFSQKEIMKYRKNVMLVTEADISMSKRVQCSVVLLVSLHLIIHLL
ncbi:penicillin-binding protein 4-like [Mercenaria mercenaria]|uniref:penicillin-binding protein 4-like n=1 Tax=Mercenaria mercenaria TaxID=6596 RepID=UPI00234F3CAC|nr:penicillin-binding protein 4-like [Mercenaria mercenaria]